MDDCLEIQIPSNKTLTTVFGLTPSWVRFTLKDSRIKKANMKGIILKTNIIIK